MFSKDKDRDSTRQAEQAAQAQAKAQARAMAASPSPARQGIPSIISADMTIVGNLHCTGDLQIEGTIEGEIRSKSVVVGESAKVAGRVRRRMGGSGAVLAGVGEESSMYALREFGSFFAGLGRSAQRRRSITEETRLASSSRFRKPEGLPFASSS